MRRGSDWLKRLSVKRLKRTERTGFNSSTLRLRKVSRARRFNGFALYEVLIGLAVFAFGVIALGRAVENCINASTISSEENVVRQILSDRMAQVQAATAVPDAQKEFKINTNYGTVILMQKTAPAALTEPDNTLITGMNLVTLTAHWQHAGVAESKEIQFYVYRAG
jgi:Tfp pilus assembly protein PilV